MISKLDYIKGLGTTAIWLTPSFKNKPVQGLGTPYPSAGYHGYWITDFTQIDPHLGTNQDLRDLVARRARRGMKVFFDIITNHTADVIDYERGRRRTPTSPRTTAPYRTRDGHRLRRPRLRGQDTFPALDPATVSFPYRPVRCTRGRASTVKVPAWLNDVTLYHNRGNTTFSGENSHLRRLLRPRRPVHREPARSSTAWIDIYEAWIRDFGVDGFRIDTMKHVNVEFWQQFLPAHPATTRARTGSRDFFMFGEVADTASNPFTVALHDRTTQSRRVLDFPFQQRRASFAANSHPTDQLRDALRRRRLVHRRATPTPTSCRPSSATTTWAASGCSCATTTRARARPSCCSATSSRTR